MIAREIRNSLDIQTGRSRATFREFVLIFLGLITIGLPSCSYSPVSNRSVKFVAVLKGPAIGENVYLTGNNSQLGNWNPSAIPMTRESDSMWTATISVREGETIEYKVTAGSWWSEALADNEDIYHGLSMRVTRDTVIYIHVYDWRNRMENGRPILTASRFRPARPYFTIDSLWKYHSGDDSTWARANFNDSDWVTTDSYIIWTEPNPPRWDGKGWFRFHMYVDSSLWNTTLAIRIIQLGASQIYYNGKLLYSFGRIGSLSTTEPNAMSWWQQFKVDPKYDQLVAVRYANYDWKNQPRMGYYPGFVIILKDLNTAFHEAATVREGAARQIAFTLIPLILFFIHLSLYGFLRNQRQNLYYAICMLGFAGITYFAYERNVIVNVGMIVLFTKLDGVSVAVAIFFGLLTYYEMSYVKFPKRFWVFLGMFCFLSLAAIAGYSGRFPGMLNYVFYGLTFLEIFFSSFRKNKKEVHGGWLVLTGFFVAAIFILLQVLVDYSIISGVLGTSQLYVYGMMGFAVSMSVFLSYNFARVNRDLETQLVNVSQLSEKAIEQERLAHKLELEHKTLELESARKSEELESARDLQLSLLPKEVPKLKGLDIAAFMKTATEVGGDYYDFFVDETGTLMIALGDATGHGLRAGNLVTATKGILNILSVEKKIEDVLVAANRAIKQMDLHMLTMCLAVARLDGNELRYASAGMPPLLIYRGRSKLCEQIVLKAMPLGAVAQFPYTGTKVEVSAGDVVAMISDGLLEIFDERQEAYGLENIMSSLAKHGDKTANEIVQGLLEDGIAWGGNAPLADDLTMVILKVAAAP